MRMSCLSVSLFPAIMNNELTIREYARFCKSQGLDGFDLGLILLKNHTPKYIKQVREDIEAEDIPLVMVTTYPDFTHPNALQREREFDFLVHDIALASAVGASYLRVTAGQGHPSTSEEDGVKWAVDYLRNAAPISDKYGITLVYENHSKPGAWEYMDFSNPPDLFLQIADGIKDTSIGINFDTANILVSGHENTVEVLGKVIDKVHTIHVAETATLGKLDPVVIGTGLAPISEVFQFLKSKKFDGWLCLEEWGNQGKEGIVQAVDNVRHAWEAA